MSLALALLTALAFQAVIAEIGLKPGLRINTTNGPIRGVIDQKLRVDVWYDVPFGAPPVGPLRFAPPVPPTPWSEERKADEPKHLCPQIHLTKKILLGEEDCLYLSVYRPQNVGLHEKLPVLFWIFGGAFFFGDAEESLDPLAPTYGWYDGRRLAANRQVVVVSVNYRLGNIGFLALPSLLRTLGTAGNWGLLDQQLAMRWVQNNIGQFGGDKTRVMIFGQSAGGISVTSHMVMPSSKGLFHSAIAQSTIAAGTMAYTPFNKASLAGELFARAVNCSNATGDEQQLSCLRNLPISSAMAPLLDYASKYWQDIGSKALPMMWPFIAWWPVVDGSILPAEPLEAINDPNAFFNDVPLVTGSTRDEGSLFASSMHLLPASLSHSSLRWMMTHWYNETVADAFAEAYPALKEPATSLSLYMRDAWFTCPTRAWLRAIHKRRKSSGSKNPSFWYLFNATMDNDFLHTTVGDYHTADLSYVFDNPWLIHRTEPPFTWSEADKKLSAQMQFYWSHHAINEDPNSAECTRIDGCINWPAYDESELHMSFAERQLVVAQGIEDWGGEDPAPNCDFWDHWGYDQPSVYMPSSTVVI